MFKFAVARRRQAGLLLPVPRGKQTTRTAGPRLQLEPLVESVLHGLAPVPGKDSTRGIEELALRVVDLDVSKTRVVILGGGTGLSTVVGGNSQLAEWPGHAFGGLKQIFPRLDVIVCTTDDGGSTGLLVR